MKKFLSIALVLVLFSSCSMSGFKPPRPTEYWRLKNIQDLYPDNQSGSLYRYIQRRNKDMTDCGIDYVIGESQSAKAALCMESKGYYLEEGPACVVKKVSYIRNDPLCVEWRKKHNYE